MLELINGLLSAQLSPGFCVVVLTILLFIAIPATITVITIIISTPNVINHTYKAFKVLIILTFILGIIMLACDIING